MALITDPDNLSQGLETSVTDAAFTAVGAQATIDSAGANLPTIASGAFFEVRDHTLAENNGLYIETGGTPTASQIVADKVDDVDPSTAGAETIRFLHDDGTLAEEKSVMISTTLRRIYLLEQGNLSTDGVTEQALYSFLKEEWKNDPDLIPNAFPMVAITPEQFEFLEGWEPRDVTSPAIQSKKLIRTGGWSERDANDLLQKQYMGVITLGNFEDNANDLAYYQLGNDPTDTTAAIDFAFAGPINEAILVYEQVTDADPATGFAITTNDTITRNDGGNWVTDGYVVGGQITIQNAEDSGNNGTFEIESVQDTTDGDLVVVGSPLTNNAADTTMIAAVDNRNAVGVFLRVRDADPNGKSYDFSDNVAIGFTTVDNKAFRFPLSSDTDLQIDATDATIDSNEPYTEVRLRYLPAAYNREVDSTTKRDFGIVVDVGTYSRENGESDGTTVFTSADFVLGSGEALTDYSNGSLIIHEGSDQGTHTISGTPVDNAGTLEITLTAALTGTETNLSFTMERATPLTATKNEIYEKVQRQLRLAGDIDETSNTVTGRTADELINFVAATDVRIGEGQPTNPNGGGSGVIIEGFDTNDTNSYSFFDNGGISRSFPFVAAGTLNFNNNLVNDSAPEYWLFFEYTTRTTVSDAAVVSPAGDTYDLESPGGNLPTLATNDFIKVDGFAESENDGLFVVTAVNVANQDYTIRTADGSNVGGAESGVTIDVDQNPIDTPDAIIVDDNSGADIAGTIGSASIAFDFDYDNNVQGGRTAGTDADVILRAIGLETAQFNEATGTITRSTGITLTLVAALERNYSNP